MNRRFFCLGLGTGIVFMALAFFITYNIYISKIVVSTISNNTESAETNVITETVENTENKDENLAKIELAQNQVDNVENTSGIQPTNEVKTDNSNTDEYNELPNEGTVTTNDKNDETKATENIISTETAIKATENPIKATEIIIKLTEKPTEKIIQKQTENPVIAVEPDAPVVTENIPEQPKMTEYKTGENVYLIPEKTNNKTVKVNIPSGSSAKDVANKLKDAGVIDDAESFRKYLADNNIADSVRAGNFTIDENSDFKAVADVLTN